MLRHGYIRIFVLATFALVGVQGYSGGAPPPKCGTLPTANMLPSHGYPAQNSPLPYLLTATDTNVNVGQNVTVTLSGSGRRTFKGFLIQAKTPDGSVVGAIVPGPGSHALRCGSSSGSGGVTHSNKNVRSSYKFLWVAPQTPGVTVSFYLTVVQDYPRYWVAKTNLQILVTEVKPEPEIVTKSVIPPPEQQPQTSTVSIPTSEQETPNPTTTTTVAATTTTTTTTTEEDTGGETQYIPRNLQGGSITYDPECGSTKGCFVDCNGEDCTYMVTWQDLGSAIQFEMYGKPNPAFQSGWIAVGFSTDKKMGDDSVTECVYDGGRVAVYNSMNYAYSNRRNVPAQLGLSGLQGYYSNGIIGCTFIRDKIVPQQMNQVFNLDNDFNIMFATGNIFPLNTGTMSKHTELPAFSSNRVNFQSTVVIGSVADYPLVKLHGCLMILAWVLFAAIGVVMARYYKAVWATKTFMKLKIWFQVHRACMIISVIFNAIAFIAIFVEVGGYSQLSHSSGYAQAHPILGIIITVLVVLNPVMAIFRPGPEHDKRPLFNWAHWAVGMSAYILSAINICFGFLLAKSQTPEYAVYIMIVYVIYIIIFDVLFEVLECLNKKAEKSKVESHEMTDKNGTDNGVSNGTSSPSKDFTRKNDRLKTGLIAVHVAVTGAFALVLMLLVVIGKH